VLCASLGAVMVSCSERADVRERTLASWNQTDWAQGQGAALTLQMDEGAAPDRLGRIRATWFKVLERLAGGSDDLCLIVEDDVQFNRNLRHNLEAWFPLRDRDGNTPFFASLYNPGQPAFWRNEAAAYFIAHAKAVWGAQAVLLSRMTAQFCLQHWGEEEGAADVRIPRLAARLAPVYYHSPSLVQHVGDASTWGGFFHQAPDFDADWRAPG
jgi:hypothetical protein